MNCGLPDRNSCKKRHPLHHSLTASYPLLRGAAFFRFSENCPTPHFPGVVLLLLSFRSALVSAISGGLIDNVATMFLLIDNYDSFTYNLFHFLGELGAEVDVHRNDALSADEAVNMAPDGIVISPGPCDPDRAGISVDVVRKAAGKIPLLGVCLGHQSLGQAFGAKIVRAPEPMHGKVSDITHANSGVFADIESPFRSTRYHSLIVERDSLPECFTVTAETEDGLIMGIEHKSEPLHGVQFHPESIATDHGHQLLQNFINICKA